MATIESRHGPDGTSTYRVRVRLRGVPPQTASFSRITDARLWASATESTIREGRYFKTAEAKRHTLSQLIDLPEKSTCRMSTRRKSLRSDVDHIEPLKRGGADSPSNLRWQTPQTAKETDRWE